MTFVFNSFAAMIAEMEAKVEDMRVRAEGTKTKGKKDELLNIAHGQQQLIWILKDTFIKDIKLMDLKAAELAAGLPADYVPLTPFEVKARDRIAECRQWLDRVEAHLAVFDRVDANDCLVAVIAKAAEANKQVKSWIKEDPAWGARMQDAAKAEATTKEG